MSTDFDDESVFKPKKEYIDMYDKISNKIYIVIKVKGMIEKIKCKLKKNLWYIDSILYESILFDESQLKYKINAKIDDTLNFAWFKIYKKNRKNRKNIISSLEVNTDKIDMLKKCTIYCMILYIRHMLKY